jgi:hypothetical protein
MTQDVHERYRRIIQDELAEFIMHELGCAMVTPSQEAWQHTPLSKGSFRYGWAPPFMVGEDAAMIVAVCPELIASVTVHLSEEELHTYLSIVTYFIEELTAAPDRPVEDVIRETENMLYEKDPEALHLASLVEARALDGRLE